MNEQYDIIIIGGGPAGATSASALAEKGYQVLVLEKEKFPRDHVGESLLPYCYDIFDEIGVLEEMEKRFSRKPGVVFSSMDGESASNWCFHKVIKHPRALSFHVYRAEFDDILLRNSEGKGAEVHEETRVVSVDLSNPERVTVKALHYHEGEKEFTGRFLIDASGQETFLPRMLGAKTSYSSLLPRVAYSTHWKGAELSEDLAEGSIKIVHLEGEKMGWCWLIPLKGDRLSIGVALNNDYAQKMRRQLSKTHQNWQWQLYLQEIQASPVIAKIIRNAQPWRPETVAINGDFSYYSAQKWGANFATIGDASAFLDPVFSSGIYFAMKGALMLAEGIDHRLKEGGTEELANIYKDIEGGYRLVERLITTFYKPDSIRFDKADKAFNQSFEKMETAYSILHLILAGDFFTNYEKYLKAIDRLRDPKNIAKYKHLIGHDDEQGKICKVDEIMEVLHE